MFLAHAFSSLRALARGLPFALDEVEHANAAFKRWRLTGEAEAAFQVELWTYCFVLRYYLTKLARSRAHDAADFDLLVSRTFWKIERQHESVERPDRYASWVSVVCKHTYINYVNRRHPHRSLDAEREQGLAGPAVAAPIYDDAGALYRALQQAIDRLPPYLQETARLRFVENAGYEDIACATGQHLATARAYVHRALTRLRGDLSLLAVLDPAGVLRAP